MNPFQIIDLPGVVLPKNSGLSRKHVRSEERWTEHYLERYDQQTLFYDCVYVAKTKSFIITAPRFLNLWFVMRKHLYVNGKRFRGRIKRNTWQRCDQISFRAPADAKLSIQHPHFSTEITPRTSISELFAGLNCALAMNKNNQLSWIKDWVEYHVKAHGLEGVCIIDNGSTDYTKEQLLAELESIKGLKAATVLGADFPYGPSNWSSRFEISPRFLQTSMMNLVKRDLFSDARAVLSVDIDELVIKNTEQNVFDAAVNSFWGAISFREIKTYPAGDDGAAYSHRDHTLVKEDFNYGNTKWCVNGKGFINRFGWAVHRFGGGYFLLTETTDFNYLHCQATTTNWKKDRTTKDADLQLVESSVAKNAIATYLS
ncbi:hypothetical protein [Reinekea thalattae]|uniref:Glycosyltransferase family 92 protein n=1 Tax=Reinekea thalattae TaxID=2593301 RepID=A0A5C8ZCZ1_9GAMM|nr:hypothetical protein [Reinekea thalattae]TXR54776.1 hypothetical protein FME95_09645 [Reinekea thalattae]